MKIEEVFKKKDEQLYNIYKEKATDLEKEYNDVGKKFDVLIGTINAERLSFRKEIRELYDFLMLVVLDNITRFNIMIQIITIQNQFPYGICIQKATYKI